MSATAAAMLDDDRGLIVGYALGDGPRPARVSLALDNAQVLEVIAAAPIEILGRDVLAALGPPPTPICGFVAKLPYMLAGSGHDSVLTVSTPTGGRLLHEKLSARRLQSYIEGTLMTDRLTLEITRFRAGRFTGTLSTHNDGTPPDISLRIRGEDVGQATLTRRAADQYELSAQLGLAALTDGVNVVEFTLPGGEVLYRYPLSAGAALAGDLSAEVASLRAELDQLKQAFRGTMAGGVITRDERPMIIAETLTQVDNILEMRDRADRFERIEFDDPEEGDETDWDIEA